VLLSPDAALRGVQSGIPDYNAVARVVPLQAPRARDPAARAGVDGEARPARPPGPEPLPPPRRPPEQPPVHP